MTDPDVMPDPAPASGRRVVRLAITGRVTRAAMDDFTATLEQALAVPGGFAVVFDRSAMTGLTPDGREALARMDADLMPHLDGRCLAWADVYDERRAASLANAERRRGSDAPSSHPYPSRVFDDLGEAERWAAGVPASGAVPSRGGEPPRG